MTSRETMVRFDPDEELLFEQLALLGFRDAITTALRKVRSDIAASEDSLDRKSCMDLLRTSYEEVVEDAARAVLKDSDVGPPEAKNQFNVWNQHLSKVGLLTEDETALSQKFYNYLSNAGTHTLGSAIEQVRLARTMAVALALLLLGRVRARNWLLGDWSAEHEAEKVSGDAATFEIVAGGEELRWSMNRKTTIRGYSGVLRASGVVCISSNSEVVLKGNYSPDSELRTAGSGLEYRLRVVEDGLEGVGTGYEGSPFRVRLRRSDGKD